MWTKYRKSTITEIRQYVPGEDMSRVSITPGINPVAGGMIARDPNNVVDQWYIEPEYFADNFIPA